MGGPELLYARPLSCARWRPETAGRARKESYAGSLPAAHPRAQGQPLVLEPPPPAALPVPKGRVSLQGLLQLHSGAQEQDLTNGLQA